MRSSQSALGVLLASSLALCGPALAQAPAARTAPRPAPRPAAPASALDIKGFRSATFGMTPAQVKTAVTADFGPAAKVQEGSNAADGTRFVLVSVDHLDPGPGAAQIGYVFGATSKTLSTINVVWATGAEATEQQRLAVAQAGEQLAAYFASGPKPAKASSAIETFGTNGLVLYSAVDHKNAGVQVLVDGVAYRGAADNRIASPPPKGPATLRVSYTLNVDKPDVKTLKPGSF